MWIRQNWTCLNNQTYRDIFVDISRPCPMSHNDSGQVAQAQASKIWYRLEGSDALSLRR